MTWRSLRAQLPLVCMVVLCLVSILLLLPIRPPDRLASLRNTTRLGRNGWDPSLAPTTAPLGEPTWSRAQPLAQTPVLWTAPPDTPEEEAVLSKLEPKPKQRRRRAILRSYDQLVELSEAIAQRKHDARYGPAQGAEPVCSLSAPTAPECHADTQKTDPALDLHAMD